MIFERLANGMEKSMNKLQELMVLTMEECGELTQRCSKIIRKFETVEEITEDQRVKLLDEMGDVYCMLELIIAEGITNWSELNDRALYKVDKLKQWSKLIDE